MQENNSCTYFLKIILIHRYLKRFDFNNWLIFFLIYAIENHNNDYLDLYCQSVVNRVTFDRSSDFFSILIILANKISKDLINILFSWKE